MFKKLKVILEDAVKTAEPKVKDITAQKAQRQKIQKDRMSGKKASDTLPKNNSSVFASKPEPNRGPGADRHPTVPRAKLTRPTMESLAPNAKAGDYINDFVHSKNKMFKGDSKKQRIKRALGAFYGKKNEEAVAMAAGAAGDPGAVQNPTSNYAAQKDLMKKKSLKQVKTDMVRRKKPVGEEFEAGIGNTQIKKDTKVKTKGKKASTPPGNGGSSDQGMPIGGQ